MVKIKKITKNPQNFQKNFDVCEKVRTFVSEIKTKSNI